MSGATANGTASAPSTRKLKSGMCPLCSRPSSLPESRKESCDLLPHLTSAGESAPVHADQADEFVALINRNQVVFAPRTFAGRADSIDQQRLHIRFQFP